MQLLSELADALLALGPAERISYAEAFERHAGIDPHRATRGRIGRAAQAPRTGVVGEPGRAATATAG